MNSDELKETKINIGCEIESQFDILNEERGNNFDHKLVLDLMMETVVNNVHHRSTMKADRREMPALNDIKEEEHSSEGSDIAAQRFRIDSNLGSYKNSTGALKEAPESRISSAGGGPRASRKSVRKTAK